jgi:hypothetical protein
MATAGPEPGPDALYPSCVAHARAALNVGQALTRLAGKAVPLQLDSPLGEVLADLSAPPGHMDSLEAAEVAMALEQEYGLSGAGVVAGPQAFAAVVMKVLLGQEAAGRVPGRRTLSGCARHGPSLIRGWLLLAAARANDVLTHNNGPTGSPPHRKAAQHRVAADEGPVI